MACRTVGRSLGLEWPDFVIRVATVAGDLVGEVVQFGEDVVDVAIDGADAVVKLGTLVVDSLQSLEQGLDF